MRIEKRIFAAALFCTGALSASMSMASDTKPLIMQYQATDGSVQTATLKSPGEIRIISRNAASSAVCVDSAHGRVWAAPELWMVASAGDTVRQPTPGGRLAGSGNGFGSIREIPVKEDCK